MEIQLRSVLDIAQVLGGKMQTLELSDGATVGDALTMLFALHGPKLSSLMVESLVPLALAPSIRVNVNGRGIGFLDGLDTVLHEGDDLLILPQLSGG